MNIRKSVLPALALAAALVSLLAPSVQASAPPSLVSNPLYGSFSVEYMLVPSPTSPNFIWQDAGDDAILTSAIQLARDTMCEKISGDQIATCRQLPPLSSPARVALRNKYSYTQARVIAEPCGRVIYTTRFYYLDTLTDAQLAGKASTLWLSLSRRCK